MRTLRSSGDVEADAWELLRDVPADAVLPAGDLIVPLAVFEKDGARFEGHNGRVGVLLENTDEPEELSAAVLQLPLIAVNFPAFNDGRGLSTAVLLRTRCGYTGDLRAVGAVLADQLNYMRRCGFSSFELKADADADAMRERLVVMSEYYQSSVDNPQPLFRRR